jgi:hypothetical protein
MAGVQGSSTSLSYPYGTISKQLAGREQQQLGPLLRAFGLGMDPGYGRFESRLQGAQGPLGDLARFVQQFTGSVPGEAQQIGQQTAARGEASYETLTNQINQSLAALPQYQAAGQQGLDYAQQYAKQAFSPVAQQPLFQEASRNLLNSIRPGLAARGLAGGGEGQRAETDATRDLAFNFAQQQMQQEAQVPGLLGGAAQQGAQLSQAGIPVAGQGMQAVGEVANLLEQQYGIPLQAIGGIMQLLTSPQQGAQGLISATAPIGLPSSKGLNVL